MERNLLLQEIYHISRSTSNHPFWAFPERKSGFNWTNDFLQEVNTALNIFGEAGGGRIEIKKDPAPKDITTIEWKGVKTVEIHYLAKAAWEKMVAAARADGIAYPLLMPTSGYRSSARQKELWNEALKKYGSATEARRWVAPPGSSAHQSGRAFDLHLSASVRNSSENAKNGQLHATKAYQWLAKNAGKFGFYPYSVEPWHWEYNPTVGSESTLPVNSNTAKNVSTSSKQLTVSKKSVGLIIESEISNEAQYKKIFKFPTWPEGQSGITIGIGYDLGYYSSKEVKADWQGLIDNTSLNRLLNVVGLKGHNAKAKLKDIKDIVVPLDAAYKVFYTSSLPKYGAWARKVYPNLGALNPDAQGAIISLVFNRGNSLEGDKRREMRDLIKLIASKDYSGMATAIRSMKRIWRDNPKMKGVVIRREKEAQLVEYSNRQYAQDELIFV